MKNNLTTRKTNIFKELSIKNNKKHGEKLKSLRTLLLLKPEDLSSVLSISTNTIKKAECGGNVGVEVIGELSFFYGYTLDQFYNIKVLPTWESLLKQAINFHKLNNSDTYKILLRRPKLLDLIEFRLLEMGLFQDWVNEKQVINYCRDEFNYNYSNATNTLNNCVKKGLLIIDNNSKPKRYKSNK